MSPARAAGDAGAFVTAVEAAREIGHIRWWERTASALLGSWARTSTDPESIAVWFDLSSHCAWRAERWAEWAPRIAALAPDSLVAPRSDALHHEFEEFSALVAGFEDVSLDTIRADRWRMTAFAAHRDRLQHLAERCDEVANRPLLRGILLSLADLEMDDNLLEALVAARGGATGFSAT